MTTFTGTFVHLVEITYQFEIEADTEEEARKKIEDDPFEYLTIDDPVDEQGLELKDFKFDE